MKKNSVRGSVFIATSLDGYIAREDGAIDWLETGGGDGEEDYGYKKFMETVDVLVMGRNTYEKVLTFGEWPYGSKPVVVLTHRPIVLPDTIAATVETMAPDPAVVARTLSQRGAKHLYVDGGRTIQGFLKEGLIHRMIITRIPVLLGSGIPLFGPLSGDVMLRHIHTQTYASGLVQSEYDVVT